VLSIIIPPSDNAHKFCAPEGVALAWLPASLPPKDVRREAGETPALPEDPKEKWAILNRRTTAARLYWPLACGEHPSRPPYTAPLVYVYQE